MGTQLFEVGEHDRQGLVRPALALLEASHHVAVGGVAGQVKAAEPLHGEDLAAPQQLGGGADGGGGVVRLAFGKLHDPAVRAVLPAVRAVLPAVLHAPHQPHPRPAHGAGVGLGMKAPVGRVFVFRAAGRAQREAPHGGALPVVGQVLDDREARAAVGAVGEGVLVAPVPRVEELGAAVVAGRDVRGDQLIGVGVDGAVQDEERRSAFGLGVGALVGGDVGARRRLARQGEGEGLDVGRRALRQDLHAGRGVAHPPGHGVPLRQGVDEGPEADALDHAAHAEPDGRAPAGVWWLRERHGGQPPRHPGQLNW